MERSVVWETNLEREVSWRGKVQATRGRAVQLRSETGKKLITEIGMLPPPGQASLSTTL